ncbi:MAG TPA: type II toxin-antitoxin system HicB family antitoxin [Candidatus Hydrogenedentes bacterium]|nr:type II toxin-antitoxin system HicB family antitoxin [Candidatus Hydrogenedentota bacterium]
MRYGIVIERAQDNYSAFVPDFPGCVATGQTIPEVEQRIREAILFHIEGLREDGLPVPEPSAICELLEVSDVRRYALALFSLVR